jgi:cell division protein ZapA
MVPKNTVNETISNGLKNHGEGGLVTHIAIGSGSNSTYEFHIAGVPYRLKTHHEAQVVEQLVGLVHQKMQQALRITRSGSYQNAAVLTALQLAEELTSLKYNAQNQIAEIESQLSNLKSKIELLENRDGSQVVHEISVEDANPLSEQGNSGEHQETFELHHP